MTLIDNINLLDLDIFEKGEVHEVLKALRHEAPVYWNEGNEELKGFWTLTRYEDVRYVSPSRAVQLGQGHQRPGPARSRQQPQRRLAAWRRQHHHHGPAAPRQDAAPGQPGLHPARGQRDGAADPRDRRSHPGPPRRSRRVRLRARRRQPTAAGGHLRADGHPRGGLAADVPAHQPDARRGRPRVPGRGRGRGRARHHHGARRAPALDGRSR